ncbi:MAG: transposase zinc-binding domain-containing protein [Saprospiraceae bacterium]|nr:transposase zinc-binding domain-containing protein [Candidatus Vicinibacter proximus]MCC6843334.1 transposase zinc-binding domain-containing protein [Saprospiraceae bacterium]
MGRHVYHCNSCHHIHYQYHCCGDRHCSNCSCIKGQEYIHNRMVEFIPTQYYHVVFTCHKKCKIYV